MTNGIRACPICGSRLVLHREIHEWIESVLCHVRDNQIVCEERGDSLQGDECLETWITCEANHHEDEIRKCVSLGLIFLPLGEDVERYSESDLPMQELALLHGFDIQKVKQVSWAELRVEGLKGTCREGFAVHLETGE